MTYSVSQTFYFRELHRSVPAGGSISLDDEIAQKYMESHPGLLMATRQTAQGSPAMVRAQEPSETPKKRGRRK